MQTAVVTGASSGIGKAISRRLLSLGFRVIGVSRTHSEDMLKNENYINDPSSKEFPNPVLSSVVVDKIVRDDAPFKLRFDPSHPDADENGYISLPNINPVIEMADLIEATRAYQANVAAFQSTKSIAQSAIDMMKG